MIRGELGIDVAALKSDILAGDCSDCSISGVVHLLQIMMYNKVIKATDNVAT